MRIMRKVLYGGIMPHIHGMHASRCSRRTCTDRRHTAP